MKRVLLTLFVFGMFATLVSAQVATGSMSGVVTDAGGAAVPGAKVATTNNANGFKSETLTSDGGLYVFPRLGVGLYDVVVEKAGFKKFSHAAIEVRVASRQELDVRL